MDKGLLLVLSGPSGTGKGTVCEKLCRQHLTLCSCISVTSRSPRQGEEDGVHYHFLPEAQFKKLIEEDSLLEWARVYGNYYGTPLKQVEEKRAQGLDVILEIDTQGAKQIREHMREAILIFLLPPSLEELWNRIKRRGTEEPEVMKERFAAAYSELKDIWYYDYVVYNNNVDDAVEKIRAIISAEKCRMERNKELLEKLPRKGGKLDLSFDRRDAENG